MYVCLFFLFDCFNELNIVFFKDIILCRNQIEVILYYLNVHPLLGCF